MQVEEAPEDKITAPMSVAIGYGVLLRHMPPPAKQQSGWSYRCSNGGVTLENTGNVSLQLSELEIVGVKQPKAKVALFPGTPQHFAGKNLNFTVGEKTAGAHMFINVMRFNKKDIVGDFSRAKALSKWLVRSFSCFVVLVGVLFSVEVSAAYSLVYSNVASGYSNCRYSETDTVATFQVRINFNTAYNNIGNAPGFWSRGVLLYTYDENGNLNPSSNIASTVTMDNFSYGGVYPGENYAMYYAKNNTYWSKQEPFAAEVKVTVLKSKIA